MDGEIVFLFISDVANRLESSRVKGIFKDAEDFFSYEHDKAVPEEIASFNIPAIFNLKETEVNYNQAAIKVKPQVAIYDVGAVSVRLRIPLLNVDPSFLSAITFDAAINDALKSLAVSVRNKVEKAISKFAHVSHKNMEENYRIYYLEGDASTLYKSNKKLIAGILLGDKNYQSLSDSYLQSTIHRNLSYYKTDIAIVDWDGTFMISKSRNYEHELLTIEVANVQLMELRVYHDEINRMVKEINKRFSSFTRRSNIFRIFGAKRQLIKLGFDIGSFYDETGDMLNSINNIVFGFGEWYIARLYSMLSDSFRLKDWYSSLKEDMYVLERIRGFVRDMINEETSSTLEIIIIALIVLELVIEVLTLLRIR
ncbi:hypothetical protein M1293_03090 [Candidatus Parvarchaeota archaeon]|nr:hypothetical protein [Candidatus Parvarchaeota archaeon]